MDNIFKQCILLMILSIAAMFLQAQLAHVLHVFLYVHNWIAHLMSGLFAGSTIGMVIQGIVALVLVPVACGAFVALIFWLGAIMVAGTLTVFYLAGGGLDPTSCDTLPLTDADTFNGFDVQACLAGDASAMADAESYADEKFAYAQTMTFSVFILYQLFNVINCRSSRDSVFKLGIFSNKAINLAILISLGLLLFFVQLSNFSIPIIGLEIGGLLRTVTLGREDWFVIVLVASTVFIIEEFRKLIVNSQFFAVQ